MGQTSVLTDLIGSELLGDTGGQRDEVIALGECGAVKAVQGCELVIVCADPKSSVTSWGKACRKKVRSGGS